MAERGVDLRRGAVTRDAMPSDVHPIGINSSRRGVVDGFNREPETIGERCGAMRSVAKR
jgi:hypothetical protein